YLKSYAWVIPVLLIARLAAFVWLRLYQRVWRYASIDELWAVIAAVAGSSFVAYAIVIGIVMVTPASALGFPRSVAITDTFLLTAFAGGWRFALRVIGVGRAGARNGGPREKALIVGSGAAALSVIREIRSNPELGFEPVGLVADDIQHDQRLLGVRVVGVQSQLANLIERSGAAVVL